MVSKVKLKDNLHFFSNFNFCPGVPGRLMTKERIVRSDYNEFFCMKSSKYSVMFLRDMFRLHGSVLLELVPNTDLGKLA